MQTGVSYLWIVLSSLFQICSYAKSCYEDFELFPKMFSTNNGTEDTHAHSLAVSKTLNMVFQGGGRIKAWIMAVNLENGRVLWRRFY